MAGLVPIGANLRGSLPAPVYLPAGFDSCDLPATLCHYLRYEYFSRLLGAPDIYLAQPRSSRGVSGDGPVGGARRGVPRLRLVTKAPGGPGPRPPGTMTWPRGARCTDPEEMPEMEARDPGRKSPRWSAERRASPRWGTIRRLASAWRAAQKRVHARLGRASARCGCRCTRAPSRRSATPRGWMKGRFKPRAQMRRGNEPGCLTS